jgi:hypothetical protein
MEDTNVKALVEFGIENILDQIRKLSKQIDMECADVITVLQYAERGANIKEAYMAIKSITNKPKSAYFSDKNRCIDFSDELGDLDVPGKKKKKGELPLKAVGALTGSNLVATLNALATNGSYLVTEDPDAIVMIKHLTLSAGIHDRITKGKVEAHSETLSRIKAELAHRKAEPSEIELQCLEEMIKRYPGYVWNNKLYFNAFVNGTPDAILFGPSGDVIRCAEFKSTSTSNNRFQKSNGTIQLILYMSIFRIPRGDLLIHNSVNGSFEYFEVRESQTKVEEKVDLFFNFRQYIINSDDNSVAHIKDLGMLSKFNSKLQIYSAAEAPQKKISLSNAY